MLKLIIGLILLIILLLSAKYVFVENFISEEKCNTNYLYGFIGQPNKITFDTVKSCCDGLRSGDETVYKALHNMANPGSDSSMPYEQKSNKCYRMFTIRQKF